MFITTQEFPSPKAQTMDSKCDGSAMKQLHWKGFEVEQFRPATTVICDAFSALELLFRVVTETAIASYTTF